MERFEIKPIKLDGHFAVFAKVEITDPKDGRVLYRIGEKSPMSEGTRAECDIYKADLEARYAQLFARRGGEG